MPIRIGTISESPSGNQFALKSAPCLLGEGVTASGFCSRYPVAPPPPLRPPPRRSPSDVADDGASVPEKEDSMTSDGRSSRSVASETSRLNFSHNPRNKRNEA